MTGLLRRRQRDPPDLLGKIEPVGGDQRVDQGRRGIAQGLPLAGSPLAGSLDRRGDFRESLDLPPESRFLNVTPLDECSVPLLSPSTLARRRGRQRVQPLRYS